MNCKTDMQKERYERDAKSHTTKLVRRVIAKMSKRERERREREIEND